MIYKELARIESYSANRLEELKKNVPRDAAVIWECAKRALNEYAHLVESSIIQGVLGDLDESVLHHKLSSQCVQIIAALMEQARGELTNEYYLTPRALQYTTPTKPI
jgi:hypothetical protein